MINKTHIEGLIYENELTLNVAGTAAKNPGMEYISGKLFIETENDNVVPIDFYEAALTSKGAKNSKFDTIKALIGANSIIGTSRETAVGIKIDSAISLNEWYKGEELVSTPRNFGGFLHTVAKPAPAATFETDIVIVNTTPEMKKNELGELAETGRLVVNGFIFDFRNTLMPVKFIVDNANGIKFFEAMEPNTFTKVWGKQVSSTIKTSTVEESAFGESKVVESEYTKREMIITGSMKEPYAEGITIQEIQEAMAVRNVALATMKKRNEDRQAQKGGQAPAVNPLSGLAANPGGFSF